MNRKVLLVEPNYKNKYPPMGLMKLATYYRMVGDDVRFYKGDMRSLAVELICEDLINHLSIVFPDIFWKDYYPMLFRFIKIGKYAILESNAIFENEAVLDAVKEYRKKYKDIIKELKLDSLTFVNDLMQHSYVYTISYLKTLAPSIY